MLIGRGEEGGTYQLHQYNQQVQISRNDNERGGGTLFRGFPPFAINSFETVLLSVESNLQNKFKQVIQEIVASIFVVELTERERLTQTLSHSLPPTTRHFHFTNIIFSPPRAPRSPRACYAAEFNCLLVERVGTNYMQLSI